MLNVVARLGSILNMLLSLNALWCLHVVIFIVLVVRSAQPVLHKQAIPFTKEDLQQ